MVAFNAGSFKALHESPFGQKLWEFLNTLESIIRLETATELERPAVEGVARLLLDQFKEDIVADRSKQMAGRMVRQILERRGYVLDQGNVRIRKSPLFTSGTRYRKAC